MSVNEGEVQYYGDTISMSMCRNFVECFLKSGLTIDEFIVLLKSIKRINRVSYDDAVMMLSNILG